MADAPTFTITVGSCGRPGLNTMLQSIHRQRRLPGDQCYVGLDGAAMTPEEIGAAMQLVHSWGEGFHAYAHTGIATSAKQYPDWFKNGELRRPGQTYSWLGVEQINFALANLPITGSHVFTIGDDDIFVDGAFDLLRDVCAAFPLAPIIYKFKAPNGWLLWERPRMRACLISGCCIAAPTPYVGLHPTDIETTHDFRWMQAVNAKARAAGHAPVWLDWVGVIARPEPFGDSVKHRGVYQCPRRCGEWRFLEDVAMYRLDRCPNPRCLAEWDTESPAVIVGEVSEDLGNWYELEGRRG